MDGTRSTQSSQERELRHRKTNIVCFLLHVNVSSYALDKSVSFIMSTEVRSLVRAHRRGQDLSRQRKENRLVLLFYDDVKILCLNVNSLCSLHFLNQIVF